MNADSLVRIVRRFSRVKLCVVGDLMLDRFVWGKVSRISPEAPVPVVHVTEETWHLGGAGNVAANVRALGGKVSAVGAVGRDEAGNHVLEGLRAIGAGVSGVVQSRGYATVRKTRIIAHQQQVVRLDREQPQPDRRLPGLVVERLERALGSCDAVVVSDYAKGIVGPALLSLLAERRGGRDMLFIDPKKGNFPHYRGATLMKPNLECASLASGIEIVDEKSLRRAGERLLQMWKARGVLISRGEEGMTLFEGRRMRHFRTAAREVFDVTGAGDTVLSAAALALAAGASFDEAAVLANRAAGIVVAKRGTATVSAAELVESLREERS